jgi:hypothetical protein
MPESSDERCEYCGAEIPASQPAQVFESAVVCAECYERADGARRAPKTEAAQTINEDAKEPSPAGKPSPLRVAVDAIRWLLALPGALLAAIVVSTILDWMARLANYYSDAGPHEITTEYMVGQGLKFGFAGASLVVVTGLIAPRFKEIASTVTFGLLVLALGWLFGRFEGQGFTNYVSSGLVALGGCIAVIVGWRKPSIFQWEHWKE